MSDPTQRDERSVSEEPISSPYRAAILGFRNYWYPACKASEVGEKSLALTRLGDKVMLLRRGGKIYGLADECPHRGTQLSIGYNEFPGTGTIVCRYHGWTFDVESGKCVAVLCEGPESAAVGAARVRTYPVEERAGIVWIWMGEIPAVPLEEDVPRFLLRPDAVVKVRHRTRYGNWRWHAENVSAGHAQLVHKYSIRQFFERPVAYPTDLNPRLYSDADGSGVIPGNRFLEHKEFGVYPNLGQWPQPSWLQKIALAIVPNPPFEPVEGLTESLLRLPGVYRVLHHPTRNCIYYEWWVPVDADHYVYFQVTSAFPKSWLARCRFELTYHLWGKPIGLIQFNNQDTEMVRQTTQYVNRAGWLYHSRATKQDRFHIEWRKYCDRFARQVGKKSVPAEEIRREPAV